ncbi:unnamed protein product [Leuciscus chuanchicus]
MEENTDVFNFRRNQGISEEAITVMEQQKIDREVILLMEDAELAKHLPSYGDRIALIDLCRHQTPSVKRKQGLLEKLREKMKLRREGNKDEEERDVLKALKDFSSVDMDDLLDIMNTYECRRRVTVSSLPGIVDEIAHKEPMFIIDCWREVTKGQISLSQEEIQQLNKDLKTTPKKVTGLLKFPAQMSENQAEVANLPKRYIRETDEDKLCKFLRFCTGSNLVVAEVIHVQFTVQTDFTKRPIGHTCGMVLELSDSYDNIPQFRAELNCVLDSNIWVMDIV